MLLYILLPHLSTRNIIIVRSGAMTPGEGTHHDPPEGNCELLKIAIY